MRTTFTPHVQHLLFQLEFNSELYTITELEDLGDGNYACDMTRKFSDGSIGYIVLNFMNEEFVVDFSISLPECTITYIVDSKICMVAQSCFQRLCKQLFRSGTPYILITRTLLSTLWCKS